MMIVQRTCSALLSCWHTVFCNLYGQENWPGNAIVVVLKASSMINMMMSKKKTVIRLNRILKPCSSSALHSESYLLRLK